jgi:hypothetical protein
MNPFQPGILDAICKEPTTGEDEGQLKNHVCHCCQLLYQDVLKNRELELQGSAAAGLVSQGKIVGRLSESS